MVFIFLTSFKLAHIVPIFKAGSIKNIENYRPISVLHVFSKIIEKMIHKRPYSFLQTFQILKNDQFDFWSHKSTSKHIQYSYNEIDTGNIIFLIFLGFKKLLIRSILKSCSTNLNFFVCRE